ncbi:MAG: hypothetical protein L6R36_001526 [Xanthoria steineri]|nr:MAG: hypothetical protein L6R36_001526 [Xanthoria steineri]
MLNFYLFPCLVLFTFLADPISCSPIQEKSREPSITITPPNDQSLIHLDFTQPPNPPPLRISSARACITSALNTLHTQDPRASVPSAGTRAHIDGVWFHAYAVSENYTYNLLTTTIKHLTNELQTRGYVACSGSREYVAGSSRRRGSRAGDGQ